MEGVTPEKLERWREALKNPPSKAEIQRIGRSLGVKNSNDLKTLIPRIRIAMSSFGMEGTDEDTEDTPITDQSSRDEEIQRLLQVWSVKKMEELVSKREICVTLYFRLKEKHIFLEHNLETIQVSSNTIF
jgi:hypothetical protein